MDDDAAYEAELREYSDAADRLEAEAQKNSAEETQSQGANSPSPIVPDTTAQAQETIAEETQSQGANSPSPVVPDDGAQPRASQETNPEETQSQGANSASPIIPDTTAQAQETNAEETRPQVANSSLPIAPDNGAQPRASQENNAEGTRPGPSQVIIRDDSISISPDNGAQPRVSQRNLDGLQPPSYPGSVQNGSVLTIPAGAAGSHTPGASNSQNSSQTAVNPDTYDRCFIRWLEGLGFCCYPRFFKSDGGHASGGVNPASTGVNNCHVTTAGVESLPEEGTELRTSRWWRSLEGGGSRESSTAGFATQGDGSASSRPQTGGRTRGQEPTRAGESGPSAPAPQGEESTNIWHELNMNDPIVSRYLSDLMTFVGDRTREVLNFPETLPPQHRRIIHMLARRSGLLHGSFGNGKQRQVVVAKTLSNLVSPKLRVTFAPNT